MGRKKAAISGQLADIDLRLLRVFKSVVDAGGFTAAELQLNLANSTISNYISDLEKRLDMRLCERGRSGFRLTQHGQLVYDATLDLLGALDDFRQRVNHGHNHLIGQLHLGFAEHMLSSHQACIVNALDLFSKQAPDVNVHISTLSSDEITTAVLDKKVDVGITVLTQTFAELNHFDLFDEHMQLYCAKGHPLYTQDESNIKPENLLAYKFVESPRLMPGREIHPDMVNWQKHAKAHHQEARATLILSGHYLGVLPSHLVANWGLDHQLKPILNDRYAYTNTFSAIYRNRHSNQAIIQEFNLCLEQVRTA